MTPRRVEDAALVSGFAAEVLDRMLAAYLPKVLPALSGEQRAEVEATHAAVGWAAGRWQARPVSASGSAETRVTEIVAVSGHDEISTAEAARMLRLSERRVRQLAAGGMGRRVGRTWLLDRDQVELYGTGRGRRSA